MNDFGHWIIAIMIIGIISGWFKSHNDKTMSKPIMDPLQKEGLIIISTLIGGYGTIAFLVFILCCIFPPLFLVVGIYFIFVIMSLMLSFITK
jgi:hypothetical protein